MKEEKYTDHVRYFYPRESNCPMKKYIRIELPNDSFFAPNEVVTVTISGTGNGPFKSTITENVGSRAPTFRMMRNMEVGDELIFPYSKWGSLRSIASNLKSTFGTEFSVRKSGPANEKGDIVVTRLK